MKLYLNSTRFRRILFVPLQAYSIAVLVLFFPYDSAANSWIGKKISSIAIEGAKRIEKDAILAKIKTKAGQSANPEQLRRDTQALFDMGYFDSIDFEAEEDAGSLKIFVKVKERPVISTLTFEGNVKIKEDDLKENITTKEWSILDMNRVKEDAQKIEKQYEEKGYYLTKVSFDVKPKKDDEVELIFRVQDFDKVMIRKISFLGNRAFKDAQLKSVFAETSEGGPLSFVSGSGSFKESALKVDLQRLTYWYLDNGYVKFRHESPVVTVGDDKRSVYISLAIEEGEKYSLNSVSFSGDLLFTDEELTAEIQMKVGEVFSISKRNLDIQKLTEKYQDLGYAFVNVVPNMKFNDEEKTIDLEYVFEKGSLVYFNEIRVLGNTKTHDKVIRRELKVAEGELYHGSKLRESKENVERLGYFAPGEIVFNTITPKGSSGIVDLEITIKERSTGSVTLGAGYASNTGFFFQSQLSEINLMGRGQTVSLSAQLSANSRNRSFNLGFTDPYAFDTRWSMGFDLFSVLTAKDNLNQTRKVGFDMRFGYPIFEFTSAYITYKLENLKVVETQATDTSLSDTDRGTLSSVVWSVVRDHRNNRFEPTGGSYQSASFETAGLGGNKKFLKWIANNRFYHRIVGDLVFRNSTEYGEIYSVGGQVIPVSERFFLGGPLNMKGFVPFSVSPKRTKAQKLGDETILFDEPQGGVIEMFSLFELEHPIIREAGLKFVTFFDVGNVLDRGDPMKLRADVGVGIRWFSPIGPLRFEWGWPLSRSGNEESPNFSFYIGPPF